MATKLQFKLEIFFYYLKKNIFFVLGGALIGVFIFTQWHIITRTYQHIFNNTEIIGIEGFYTEDSLPQAVSQEISYGLTKVQDNGKAANSPIVESLVIENENHDYVFTLNKKFTWHNGHKLKASDINYQINGLTVTQIADDKVKISASTSFAPLLVTLSKPLFKKNLVGLGPYKVNQIEYQDGFIKKISLISLDSTQKNKTYLFFPSEKDVLNAYKLGEIDTASNLSSDYDFTVWPKTKITPLIQSNQKYIAVFMNTAKIGNKQTRQALAYATPKTNDKNERCLGPISPESWAYNANIKEYIYDPDRAKDLFDKNKIDQINLSVTDRRLLPQAEAIKTAWEQNLGLKVVLTIENQIDPTNYDAVIAYASIPTDPDQYAFWHSTQTDTNITHLNNSRIDKLLEEGRQSFNAIERKAIYLDFQKFLLEESPAIFISYPTTYTVQRTT